MDALDILEKRIDTLINVIGPVADYKNSTSENDQHKITSENIVDSLLLVTNIMNEAISHREQIKSVISRNKELEKYLEPNFLEECQQIRTKEVYLSAIGHDLHKQCTQLNRMKELEPTLGAEYFRNIPGEAIEKLKQINEDNEKFSQEAESMEESLILAMKRCGEIQSNLLESLEAINKRVTMIEERVQRKKHEEMEKELPTSQSTN